MTIRAPETASHSSMVRVALVDDDPFVLTALRTYLDSSDRIEVLSTFSNGADALAFLRRVRADVLLTDVRMPRMDGLELLSRVRQDHPGVAVVVLTSFDDDQAMLAALSASANGFLLKDSTPEEIIRAVLAAADGGTT
ncbi:response regulator transcription factor, partial [Actinomyces slackii]